MRFAFSRYFGSNPPAVGWLLFANIAVALAIWTSFALRSLANVPDDWILTLFALPADPAEFLFRPWTLVTYTVAQSNIFQLLFNMLWLVWFGRWLMMSDSQATIVALYFGGGILGGMAYVLCGGLIPGSGTILMGSSASVLSIMVYTALRQPGRHVPLFLIGDVRLKWIAIFTVILTLIGGAGLASHLAHIGGALFPFILIAMKSAASARRTPKGRKRKCPKALKGSFSSPLRPRMEETPSPNAANTDNPDNPEKTLDALLDKIRISGYDSLSDSEKFLLASLSSKI